MILTSDKQIEKELPGAKFVTPGNLPKFDKDTNIKIIVGSRELVRTLENISLPNLRFIQLLSAGYEGIDLEKIKSRGIQISNAANVYSVGMAEFIVFAILMTAKKYNKSIKRNNIRYQRGYKYITELESKTVGILGAGAIGIEVAKRLSGFNMRILGYDLIASQKPYFDKIYNSYQLNEILPQCDYVVVTLPLNEKTVGSINQNMFSKMKKDVTIVNVGRQALFNKKDFLTELKKNKKMTAILDMFEIFPNPITNPFRRLSNVKVLPGVTAISQEISKKRLNLVLENIELVLNHQTPKFIL